MRRLIWIVPLSLVSLLVVFVLFGMAADAWLESSGGRSLLQRELSKSLGLPVRLDGDYSLKLFPRLKIAGSRLQIDQPDGKAALASSKEYSAVIELKPLLHRELRIVSIGLRGGFVDISRVPNEGGDGQATDGSAMPLPAVASLEIHDFSVRLAPPDNHLLIRHLQLTGFQAGRAAGLDIDAGWLNGPEETAQLRLQGGLTVMPGSLSSRLDIREMELKWGETLVQGLKGEWHWDQPAASLDGQMSWEQSGQAAAGQFKLALGAPMSGSLAVQYHQESLPPSRLTSDFTVLPDQVGLQTVGMEIAGQSLAGDGCLWLTDPVALHLNLQAAELDLDKIYAMMPEQQAGGTESPIDLAIHLHAEKAWMAGAEADDVNVAIGPEPACTGPNP